MRTHRFLLAALFAVGCACGKQADQNGQELPPDPEPVLQPVTVPAFARGADVSWLSEMEGDKKTFKKKDGTQADLFDVLKDCGLDAIRLRVWVNPTGGWSGKEDVVALAKRTAAAGMCLMVDFHYSDFFADPSRQTVPAAWDADKGDLNKMCQHVAEHTQEVLKALKEAGVAPAWIQVGNETRNGMLWPAGQLWNDKGDIADGRKHFAQLYMAGYNAAKAVFPDAVVMPHLNNAYEDNAWWFKQIKEAGATFDAIALSHYPQAESKFTAEAYNQKAVAQVKALYSTFKVPVFISEVGVKAARNDAAATLLSFMDAVKDFSGCAGVFYWEPEVYGNWKPKVYNSLGWNAYDQGAFAADGRPLAIMDAFNH